MKIVYSLYIVLSCFTLFAQTQESFVESYLKELKQAQKQCLPSTQKINRRNLPNICLCDLDKIASKETAKKVININPEKHIQDIKKWLNENKNQDQLLTVQKGPFDQYCLSIDQEMKHKCNQALANFFTICHMIDEHNSKK